MPQTPKTFLSTREVAELLDVNEKVVYSLIAEKGLPACKVTGKWIFPRHLTERWIESHVINYPPQGQLRLSGDPLIIAGSSDLLVERTIALFNTVFPEHLCVFGAAGSLGGIKALGRKQCHIATSHLMHSDEKEYNFAYLAEHIQGPLPVVVNFCLRQQGIMVVKGNPKHIEDVRSFLRPDVVIANRPVGTGTRLLLEHELHKEGIDPARIEGIGNEFPTHLSAALEVLAARADAAPGIQAAAVLLGLDFIPVRRERYDLLIAKDLFFEKAVQRFLSLLQENAFRNLAQTFAGYDLSHCGHMAFSKD